jgi:hypothetical protein
VLIGFLDDTEIVVDPEDSSPDVFVFGGYFIRQDQLHAFQERIAQVKRHHGLPSHAPVKWNLRDTGLRDFYGPENWLDLGQVDQLMRRSTEIRRNLLGLLGEFEATILISGRYDISRREATNNDYYQWAFENLLQRVGLMFLSRHTQECDASSTMLVVDWPQRGIDKSLFDIYLGGYYYGRGISTRQGYYSGPLNGFRLMDSLMHGSTLHSGPLQVADLVVGCCRDFLYWAWRRERLQRIQGIFDLLIPRFHRDENGRLNNCGFKVAKANNLNVEGKIDEYLQRQEWIDVDELTS